MMLFGLCDGGRGASQMLTPPIVIVWVQLRHVGLTMLSECLNLALSHPNLSVIRIQMAVSEELQVADTC